MEDWLQKQREKYGLGLLGIGFSFLFFFSILSTVITLISDMGFSDEVTKYRWVIIVGGALLAAFIASVWWALNIRWAYNEAKQNSEQKIQSQHSVIADLKKEKESLFRLMEKHQEEAEEHVIIKLRRLALISIQQQEWLQFGPHIISFRIEPKPNINLTLEQEITERLTVNINLSNQHRVTAGMVFQVQDPVDKKPYGIIVVKEAHLGGSTCEVIDIEHNAFWDEALTAIREDRQRIITAPKNELAPKNTIEIDPKVAADLLNILNGIKIPDLS